MDPGPTCFSKSTIVFLDLPLMLSNLYICFSHIYIGTNLARSVLGALKGADAMRYSLSLSM
jgi:hypothetical protein